MSLETTYATGWDGDQLWIRCKICGLRSFNRNDVENRYCGFCHKFHDLGYYERVGGTFVMGDPRKAQPNQKLKYWLAEAGPPPDLQSLIGAPVTGAWLTPERNLFLVTFDGGEHGKVIMADINNAIKVKDHVALSISVGDLQQGADFDNLGMIAIDVLKGYTFTGLDGNVLTFSGGPLDDVGFLFLPGEPIQPVKAVPKA